MGGPSCLSISLKVRRLVSCQSWALFSLWNLRQGHEDRTPWSQIKKETQKSSSPLPKWELSPLDGMRCPGRGRTCQNSGITILSGTFSRFPQDLPGGRGAVSRKDMGLRNRQTWIWTLMPTLWHPGDSNPPGNRDHTTYPEGNCEDW